MIFHKDYANIMISRYTRIVLVINLIIILCACNLITPEQPIAKPSPGSTNPAHFSIRELDSAESLLVFEVAGSYQEIGYVLGAWYRDRGLLPQLLNEQEKKAAMSLISFYESIDSKIVDQIRGMYLAYGLDLDEMEAGIPVSDVDGIDVLLPGLIRHHSCSVVFARPEINFDNHPRLGRNYDYPEEIQDLTLMFTYPDGGYPTAIITPRTPGLTAADGINSQGLALGFASVEDLGYDAPPGEALISSFAYRYILEHSASVDEAMEWIRSIPIKFVPSSPPGIITHLLIADQSGDSAVVEFLPGGVIVNRSHTPFQVMTNNLWVDVEERTSCDRYRSALMSLESGMGTINSSSLMDTLSDLRSSTQYSVVYDLQELSLMLTLPSSNFSNEYEFSLSEFMERMQAGIE